MRAVLIFFAITQVIGGIGWLFGLGKALEGSPIGPMGPNLVIAMNSFSFAIYLYTLAAYARHLNVTRKRRDEATKLAVDAVRYAEGVKDLGLALADAMEVRMRDEKRRMEEMWAEERAGLEMAWEERKAEIIAESFAAVLSYKQEGELVWDEKSSPHLRLVQPLQSDDEDKAS